jgi:hypothetical protein
MQVIRPKWSWNLLNYQLNSAYKKSTWRNHGTNSHFFSRGETIENYIKELKILSSTCEFETLKEFLIRDRIVGGINSEQIRSKLLQEDKLRMNWSNNLSKKLRNSYYPTSTRRHGNFAGVHTLLRIILSSNSAVLINIITGVSPPHFDFFVFYVHYQC